jgi:hypothetical protein
MYGWLASQLGLDHVTCEMSALQGVHRRRGSRLVVHGHYEQPQQYRQPRVAGESSLGGTRAERRLSTLSVISWADHEHGLAIARTMGMVTFALFILFFSIESKDQRDSAFSLDTFSDKTFIITTSGSFVLLVLSTVLSIFQAVMKTVRLDVRQWLICTAVALTIVAAAEIRKAALRQAAAKAIHPARGPGPEPLPAERPPGA